MKSYPTSAGLYRGLLYNLVKTGKRASIELTSIGTSTAQSEINRVVDNIIDYDNNNIFTSIYNSNFGQWVQVELKDRFIDLKAYALGHNGGNYPRYWDIQVSMDGVNWNTPHQIRENDESKNGHIFRFDKNIGFIRYFKIINRGMNGENDSGNNELYLTNIDLYGNVVECNENCTLFPHLSLRTCHCKTKRTNLISVMLLLVFA